MKTKHKNCVQCLWKRHKWTFISISFKLISTLVPPRQVYASHKCILDLLITPYVITFYCYLSQKTPFASLGEMRSEREKKKYQNFHFRKSENSILTNEPDMPFFQLQDIPHSLSKMSLILNILSRFVPPPPFLSHSPLHLLSSREKCINAALCVSACMCVCACEGWRRPGFSMVLSKVAEVTAVETWDIEKNSDVLAEVRSF